MIPYEELRRRLDALHALFDDDNVVEQFPFAQRAAALRQVSIMRQVLLFDGPDEPQFLSAVEEQQYHDLRGRIFPDLYLGVGRLQRGVSDYLAARNELSDFERAVMTKQFHSTTDLLTHSRAIANHGAAAIHMFTANLAHVAARAAELRNRLVKLRAFLVRNWGTETTTRLFRALRQFETEMHLAAPDDLGDLTHPLRAASSPHRRAHSRRASSRQPSPASRNSARAHRSRASATSRRSSSRTSLRPISGRSRRGASLPN